MELTPDETVELIRQAFAEQYPDPDERTDAALRTLREIERAFGLHADLEYKFFLSDDDTLGFFVTLADDEQADD